MYNVSLETYNNENGLAYHRRETTQKMSLNRSGIVVVIVRRSVGVTGSRIGSVGIIRRVVGRSVRVIVGRPVRVAMVVRRAIGVVIIGRIVGVIVVVGRPVGVVIVVRRAVGVGVGRFVRATVLVGRAVG